MFIWSALFMTHCLVVLMNDSQARGSPIYKNYQCVARHAPDLPDLLRRDIIDAEHSEKALQSAEKGLFKNATIKNLVGTTQAIDLVHGGVKVNALPERAYAVVNHRVSVERRETPPCVVDTY